MPKDLTGWDKPLRKWQNSAWGAHQQSTHEDFLVVATPGSGKTTFALRIAHGLLGTLEVSRIVVVCPTEHLKRQWAKAAADVGIDLDHEFSNADGRESGDYHGVVITYAQVASYPDIHRIACSRTKTLVILDEIHHAGDELTWGTALRDAFDPAKRRLLLSGTPFRTDSSKIPYVAYKPVSPGTMECVPDYSYGYAEALSDGGVCRELFFPSFEGNMQWLSRSGSLLNASFSEPLNETQDKERLRTALAPSGEYIQEVLKDADSKLSILREDHPAAAGLVIAMDQRHAREIANQLVKITGKQVTIAVSDDPGASDNIERFSRGRDRWIVAVKMVSEGVDIPRLRICVYATNVVSELFFRQATGRVIRWMHDLSDTDQSAYFYIPKHRRLIELALQIQEERKHQLEEVIRELRREQEGPSQEPAAIFQPISAEGWQDGVVHGAKEYTQSAIDRAQRYKEALKLPANYEPAQLARLLDMAVADGYVTPSAPSTAKPANGVVTLTDRKTYLRKVINRMVAELRERTGGGNVRERNMAIYGDLNKRQGLVNQDKATEKQLQERIRILEQLIANAA